MRDTPEKKNTRRETPPAEKLRGKRLIALILAVSLGVGVIGGLFLMMFYPTAGAVIVLGYTPVCALMLWLLLHGKKKD